MAKIKALVVDDSKVMRLMVMKALRQSKLAEFDIDEAEDGARGLEAVKRGSYQIVFADINMPNMNGIEMVRAIRAEIGSGLPIVMVTSEKVADKIDEAVNEAGANAYVIKPFDVDQLREKIGPILERREESAKGSGGLFSKLVNG